MKLTPEFLGAIKRHRQSMESLGADPPFTMRAFALAMHHAPTELIDEFAEMAKKMGVLPQASGYLEDGTEVYALDKIASNLGVTIAEAEAIMDNTIADRDALGLPNIDIGSNQIHSKQ